MLHTVRLGVTDLDFEETLWDTIHLLYLRTVGKMVSRAERRARSALFALSPTKDCPRRRSCGQMERRRSTWRTAVKKRMTLGSEQCFSSQSVTWMLSELRSSPARKTNKIYSKANQLPTFDNDDMQVSHLISLSSLVILIARGQSPVVGLPPATFTPRPTSKGSYPLPPCVLTCLTNAMQSSGCQTYRLNASFLRE